MAQAVVRRMVSLSQIVKGFQKARRSEPSTKVTSSTTAALPFASPRVVSLRRAAAVTIIPSVAFPTVGIQSLPHRGIATYGRITDEDRRWWLVHLECCPDVTPGTFITWLDSCGTHTAKKLIERDVWTIEQVAALSSDVVDELRYKEGCIHMDVVWEHARTVLQPLTARMGGKAGSAELQARILELRKKRELEKRKGEILQDRADVLAERERMLRELRENIAARRETLRQKRQQQAAGGGAASGGDAAAD